MTTLGAAPGVSYVAAPPSLGLRGAASPTRLCRQVTAKMPPTCPIPFHLPGKGVPTPSDVAVAVAAANAARDPPVPLTDEALLAAPGSVSLTPMAMPRSCGMRPVAEVAGPSSFIPEGVESQSTSPRAPANVQIHSQFMPDAVGKANALVRSIVEKYELGDQGSVRRGTLASIAGG